MISNQIHALVQWYPILSPSVPPPSRFLSDPPTLQPGRCCVCVSVCVCVCVLAVLCSLWDLRSLTRDQTCALSSRGMESQPWTLRDVPGALSFDKDSCATHRQELLPPCPPLWWYFSHGRSVHLPMMLKPCLTYYYVHNRKPHILCTGGRK